MNKLLTACSLLLLMSNVSAMEGDKKSSSSFRMTMRSGDGLLDSEFFDIESITRMFGMLGSACDCAACAGNSEGDEGVKESAELKGEDKKGSSGFFEEMTKMFDEIFEARKLRSEAAEKAAKQVDAELKNNRNKLFEDAQKVLNKGKGEISDDNQFKSFSDPTEFARFTKILALTGSLGDNLWIKQRCDEVIVDEFMKAKVEKLEKEINKTRAQQKDSSASEHASEGSEGDDDSGSEIIASLSDKEDISFLP